MGRGDNNGLSEAEELAAHRAFHTMLEGYGEPKNLKPPADLAARIARQVPKARPAELLQRERRQRLRRNLFIWGIGLAWLALSALGLWGIMVDSSLPSLLFGGPQTALGHAILAVTLAAKPIFSLLSSINLLVWAIGLVTALTVGWVWWKLLTDIQPMVVTGNQL
jgi:hypothetical protein